MYAFQIRQNTHQLFVGPSKLGWLGKLLKLRVCQLDSSNDTWIAKKPCAVRFPDVSLRRTL
jgi:hypothetical protein